MRVVILNTAELTGGAAVAANRLMKALARQGVEVAMLTRDRRTADRRVTALNDNPWARRLNFLRFAWERLVILVCNRLSRRNLFQVSIANTGTDLAEHPLVRAADVIHLHWVNQGFLSLSGLGRLLATGKPVVWTLHDLWPATAICHYPGGCERYHTGCARCPMLSRGAWPDLAAIVARRKKALRLGRIAFVGCSRWIADEARKSAWIGGARISSIPNPIDISLFRPVDRQAARERFGLPKDKRLLLFAAAKLSDTRKGASFLIEACGRLKERFSGQMEVVLMGSAAGELAERLPFPAHALGYLSDPEAMVAAYAGADLFVIPSLEDNLPNTIMEAMACGTPCVGFATGGIPEMIDHRVNGYVARCRDAVDLAEGIGWVVAHPHPEALREACVRKVSDCYAEAVVARRYLDLYQRLTNE